MLRFLTAGESHGPALVVIVEGLPAGLPVTVEDIGAELARRRLGLRPRSRACASSRTRSSSSAGVRHGRTLGSPVAIEIGNTEWPKWDEEMSPAPGATEKPLTQPRPGHADLAGMQKYGFDDARDVLERASARETAARVAAGALPRRCSPSSASRSSPTSCSSVRAQSKASERPGPDDLERVDESAVRCFDPDAEAAMIGEIEGRGQGGRLARRRRRGARLRRARRPR